MATKQKIKRLVTKAHRKVFGKPKEIMVTTGKGGLTKAEISDVLATLSKARTKGLIPAFSYEYKPPIPLLSPREALFLIPKTVPVSTARVKLRAVLEAVYGTKYTLGDIQASRSTQSQAMDNTQLHSKVVPSGRSPRITKKGTPRITGRSVRITKNTPRLR